jgi:N-6 DNA Methylase
LPTTVKLLFRPEVLHLYLSSFELPERVHTMKPKLAQWAEMITSGRIDTFTERELLPRFLTDFFYGILGYCGPEESPDRYTISVEKLVEVDGNFADAVIGNFHPSEHEYFIALEGKGSKDPLDRPFAGRRMSAVDQGYRYAINLPCDWIIVTSMRQTRLYHKGSDQYTYERFNTEDLATDDSLLNKFVFLLGAERVTPQSGRCHLDKLLSESVAVGREMSKAFYLRYADIREDAFERLRRDNPTISAHDILSRTQTILDRILFSAFSEDRGLLPPNTIRNAYEHTDPYNPRPIWDNFRGLFNAINTGSDRLNIPKYNGGLFRDDPILDSLAVSDEVCRYFRDLSEFDYRPAQEVAKDTEAIKSAKVIDVDILGHIFEQSITDLEVLRNELDGLVERLGPERHKTRRKKEGAFYTPSFITRYIVEQTLGNTIKDRFEHLRQRQTQESGAAAQPALADPNAYDLDTLKKPHRAALMRFWEAWQDELGSIRILDPACGSGAFLIEAFDQLHAQYQVSNDRLEELRGYRTLFDLDSHILLNNLFGVDVNEEAVEICKLSLWVKTAQRGKVLTELDKTIRVGNSVVDDPAIDPKAFDWSTAFSDVFAAGGFDVVVANPPYIRQEWLGPYKPYWEKRFGSYHGVADIFIYFFELGVGLLREGGRLGFITSGSWVRSNSGSPLRKFLSEQAHIESMIDFGEYQPFEGAEMIRPTITALSKRPPGGRMRVFKWLTKGKPPENLSDVIQSAPSMSTDHLRAETWELESNEVRALRKKMLESGTPLRNYAKGRLLYGIKTGLNDVFIIDQIRRQDLIDKDAKSAEIIKPLIQGQNLRPWYIENSEHFLLFTRRGIHIESYPAVLEYLTTYRRKLEPKPTGWSDSQDKKWQGRKAGAYRWMSYKIPSIIGKGLKKQKLFGPISASCHASVWTTREDILETLATPYPVATTTCSAFSHRGLRGS